MIIKDNFLFKRGPLLKDVLANFISSKLICTNQSYKLILNKFPFKHKQDLYWEYIIESFNKCHKIQDKSKTLKIIIPLVKITTTTLVFEDNGIGIDLERNRDKVLGFTKGFMTIQTASLGLYL
jgi:hypothetical protein